MVRTVTGLYQSSLSYVNTHQTLVQGGLSGIILAWANEITGFNNERQRSLYFSCHQI